MAVFRNLSGQIVGDEVEVDDRVVAGRKNEIVAARLYGGPRTVTGVLTEAYLDRTREMVEIRNSRPHKDRQYTINIKVHSLDLTRKQKSFIYDNWEEMMGFFWNAYIIPWIESEDLDIYSAGRSSGWLVLDRQVVGLPRQRRDVPRPPLHEARDAYRDVKRFREGWDSVFSSMKEELNRTIKEGSG